MLSILVWIIGSSIIRNAHTHSKNRPVGVNLGLKSAKITWIGSPGMDLLRLQNVLGNMINIRRASNNSMPGMIVFHCGGNDIGKLACKQLIHIIQSTFSICEIALPETKLVFSNILPRQDWRFSDNNKAMNRMRQRINRSIKGHMVSKGGFYIHHTDLDPFHSGIYKDGIHLSYIGNDIFLNTLQCAIENFINRRGNVYPLDE